MFVDSHCHLDLSPLLENEAQVLQQMKANQVDYALCISVNIEDSPRVLSLAQRHAHLFASVGVHPEEEHGLDPDEQTLIDLALQDKVVAIGECGLDYHWHPQKPEWQQLRFATHIQAAIKSDRPLIIHTRKAAEETIGIMRELHAEKIGGVMHCFTESKDIAKKALDMGFYISFSGIVTFKNARELKEVAQFVPADRLLIETDSPYLAPMPNRGKSNQPAWVIYVAQELARLRGVSVEQIAKQTTDNFFNLFKQAAWFVKESQC